MKKKSVDFDSKSPYSTTQKKKDKKTPDYIDEPLSLTKTQIIESFRWLTPEIKSIIPVGKHKVRIKGIVARAGDVSKNGRKYVAKELMKSVSSMIGIPIVVNHDSTKIIGNTELAEWEDEQLEVVGIVKDKQYAELLKNRDSSIKGLSMEADYIFTRCIECGKPLFNELAFKDHMRLEHGIIEGLTVPHGIKHKQLALVVGPEIPGLASASVSIAETKQNGFLKLTETIIKEKMQFGEPKDEHGCEPDERWDAEQGKCVSKAAESEGIGASSISPDSALSPPAEDEKPEGCPPGTIKDPETGLCVAPDTVITKIDAAFQEYKHVMEIDISGQLKTIQGFCQTFDTRLRALETKDHPGLKETLGLKQEIQAIRKEVTENTNRLSHIKGQFKGHTKIVESQAQALDENLPYTTEKKK